LDDDELRVFRAFNRAFEALTTQLDRDLEADCGLPRTYFDILWRLRREPGQAMRMTRLAEVTRSKASRITHAVGRLEEAGLIRREVPAGDRRGWVAVLTDEGLKRAEEAAPRYAKSVREHFLDVLSEPMKQQLVEIGEHLLGRIDPAATARVPQTEHGWR
jgi:DNA-binding MarR family transcriptional regulator